MMEYTVKQSADLRPGDLIARPTLDQVEHYHPLQIEAVDETYVWFFTRDNCGAPLTRLTRGEVDKSLSDGSWVVTRRRNYPASSITSQSALTRSDSTHH